MNMGVSAVIPTFRPTVDVVRNIEAIANQVKHVVVVDNGSSDEALEPIRAAERRGFLTLIENGTNLGIGSALNIGIEHALASKDDFVLLLDQDSLATPEMVTALLADYRRHPESSRIGLLATRNVDPHTNIWCPPLLDRNGDPVLTMSSGSLIPVQVIRQAGLLDADLFIEFVDHEYCLRLRSLGYKIVISNQATLLHEVGFPRVHSILGIWSCVCTHHSARRRYYSTRNLIVLLRRYAWTEPSWCWVEIRSFLKNLVKITLFEDKRLKKLGWTLLGMVDGIRNRLGAVVPI